MHYYDRMLQVLHRWRQQLLISNKFISILSGKFRIKSLLSEQPSFLLTTSTLTLKVGVKYQAVVLDAGWRRRHHITYFSDALKYGHQTIAQDTSITRGPTKKSRFNYVIGRCRDGRTLHLIASVGHLSQWINWLADTLSVFHAARHRIHVLLLDIICNSSWMYAVLSLAREKPKFGERAIVIAALVAGNSLPCSVCNWQSVNSFKTVLKTFLFSVNNWLFHILAWFLPRCM